MKFEELINKYGQKELAFELVKVDGEQITFLADAHGNDENGALKHYYFKVKGNFKLHTFKDDDGLGADCSIIESYDVQMIDQKRKIYALYEMMGAYMEFSVDNCRIEQLAWDEYKLQHKMRKN